MASALGSSARRDRGARVADIRDFGAVAQGGVPAATANRIAIQAAHDHLVAIEQNSTIGGEVYIPSGDWYIDIPIFLDGYNIGIRGDGRQKSRIIATVGHDVITTGVMRTPSGVALTADHIVDLYTAGSGGTPILDSTAVSGINQRWGYRTKADCHIAQQGGLLDADQFGSYYKKVRTLTIDFAIDLTRAPGTGAYPSQASIMGLTETGASAPYEVLIVGNRFYVRFRTALAGVIDGGTMRDFYFFTIPTTPGFYRVSIQIDLVNAAVSAWVNGALQTPSSTLGADFVAASNLSFAPNQHCPFGIGSNALSANGIADFLGSAIDCTFCGLKISSVLIYSMTGGPQTRIDAAPITDYNRYFGYDGATSTIGQLPMTDSPATITPTRLIKVTGRFQTGAYFLDNAQHGVNSTTVCNRLQDLTLRCSQPPMGRAITSGFSIQLQVLDCELQGGANGIGSINFGASYPILIRDCIITGGSDSAIYLYFSSSIQILNTHTLCPSRASIRLLYSSATIRGLFSPNYGTPDYTIKATRSFLTVEDAAFDSEDVIGGASIAHFYVSAGSFLPIDSVCHLRNITVGAMRTSASFLILEDNEPEDNVGSHHCLFSMSDISLNDQAMRSVVRTNGGRWQGEFRAEAHLPRPNWVENTAGPSNVIARHTRFIGPPRDGIWTKNANILSVINPSIGQYREWRCILDGSYGTANPPTWLGLDPMDDGSSLAAYISDNSYMSVSGAPVAGQGFWGNAAHATFLQGYFGGTMPPFPSTIYAALSARGAVRVRYCQEVSGPGYARVAVPTTSWGSSSGGIISNIAAITFPTATGVWNFAGTIDPVGSLVFMSAATGGNIIAAMDIATLPVIASMTPSIPIGAITVKPALASPQGNFTTAIHDAMNQFWFKSQTYTAPTIYLALSTTASNTTTPPTEPSGGGYARLATTSSSWSKVVGAAFPATEVTGKTAVISNAIPLSFAASTTSWGTVKSVYLMDSATGGNVLASANLALARTIAAGDPPRSFAPGALWVCRS